MHAQINDQIVAKLVRGKHNQSLSEVMPGDMVS